MNFATTLYILTINYHDSLSTKARSSGGKNKTFSKLHINNRFLTNTHVLVEENVGNEEFTKLMAKEKCGNSS